MPAAGEIITAAGQATIAAGTVNVTISASTFGTATVAFPAGRFSAAPYVTANVISGAGAAIRSTVLLYGLDATGMTVRVDLNASSTTTVPVHWQAILE